MAPEFISQDLQDWPKALTINVVTIDLGKSLYYAECAIWGGSQHFEALTYERKAFYIDQAAKALQALAPPNLFAFATRVAQAAAARVKATDENGGAQ